MRLYHAYCNKCQEAWDGDADGNTHLTCPSCGEADTIYQYYEPETSETRIKRFLLRYVTQAYKDFESDDVASGWHE